MSRGTLFEADRMSLEEAIQQTVDSLGVYGRDYPHWALAYSGGKDSSAALTVTDHVIETGRVPRPESLTVLYVNTQMELPPLHLCALANLEVARRRGHRAFEVLPDLDNRFFVYMLGRGVPPPSNTFRWCTERIKIRPMLNALRGLREQTGRKLLMLTGVRMGESAARDGRISLSCSRDGGECGQGWFQESTPQSVADTLAPLLHWRVCHVWDWLVESEVKRGWRTADVARVYDADQEGSANEVSARTGCVGCNLASQDFSLQRVLRRPEWAYLEPLRRLKPLYASLKEPSRRLRKPGGETKADGTLCANQGRMGPLTLEARLWGLEQVLSIQAEVNDLARVQGRTPYVLIGPDEEARIRELVALGTWPDGWEGTEPVADTLAYDVLKDGSVQHWLFGSEGSE
jgi:DNA sulfur modification protein DndC